MQHAIGKRIMVLTAHPDDESFLAAGTIYQHTQAGSEVVLVCATRGEKGDSHLAEPLSESELAQLREKELLAATAALGVQSVHILNFHDGKVDHAEQEICGQVLPLIEQVKPDALLSFGPDGVTGHKDHVAIAAVALKLARHFKLPLVQFCIPKIVAEEAKVWLRQRRKTPGHYHEELFVPEEHFCVEINSDIKMRALQCYKSQLDAQNPFAGYPDHIAKVLVSHESFCIVEPES